MTPGARRTFVIAAGAILTGFFLLFVVRPAVDRGGWGELALVFAIGAAVLLFERYLRSR